MYGIDRISDLSDDVLVCVLSFLPTKISVSTGVLSKRWSLLWTRVPNLDFDSSDYDDAVMSFSNIINGVMTRHKELNIHTFRLLHCKEYGCTDSELERWIAILVDRNVRKLDIFLDYQLMLPGCLFTCKTLVDLCLKFCGVICTTSNISLPNLKKLSLEMVKYESDNSLAHLLSGCPVLEELVINSANYMNMGVWCCISSPTLKRLVLRGRVYLNVSADRLTSLNEVDICFDNARDILHIHHVMDFVGKMCNVKSLTLSTGWMEVSDAVFSSLNTIRFHNLRELQLYADWRFITKFIEIADNLRFLTFNIVCASTLALYGRENLDLWMEPKQVPTCLVSHLGTVRINQFWCTEQAFNMVRYILKNAKVLKKIEICFRSYGIDSKERSEARRIISLFERGSESCQLAFQA